MDDETGVVSECGASGARRLARLCDAGAPDWMRHRASAPGISLLEAWFQGRAYTQHRHDTYAIGVTEAGVQAFGYQGSTHISMPGDVVVLHPDELHDGYAGAEVGFGYRLLYIEPALIFAAAREATGRPGVLPFVRQPVLRDSALAAAIQGAFTDCTEPLAADELVLQITLGLLEAGSPHLAAPSPRTLDMAAIARARSFLEAERSRVVRSDELEAVSGLTRFDLARQFRAVVGVSPYRYSLLRRLDAARDLLGGTQPLAAIALETGFADQSHFTRMFTAANGISPGRYRALESPHQSA